MNVDEVRQILKRNDGSLPDINFDFGHKRVVGDAYALIQRRATHLASTHAYYWSRGENREIPIRFGENPALAFLRGDGEGFHVVFGGLRSTSGAPIPDLGVFVLDADYIALDYRMGPEWDEPAILGLFEIIEGLRGLSDVVTISHVGNIFDSEEEVLLTAFWNWTRARSS